MLERLQANLAEVQQRMAEAARRSGRDASAVELIAVTKYVDASMTGRYIEAGCRNLGENRPQVLWDKAASLAGADIRWHMIGHLQRNKVKRTVAIAHLIHSVDRLRLLRAIDDAGRELGQIVSVLLEVNLSGEAAKHGFSESELGPAWEEIASLGNVSVQGLMGMSGLHSSPDAARRQFAKLREIAESHRGQTPPNVKLDQLSMGMSGDFEIAIEEGATLVRIGSILLEGIERI